MAKVSTKTVAKKTTKVTPTESTQAAKNAGGSQELPWSLILLGAGLAIVLLISIGMSLYIDGSLAGDAKKEQAAQEKQIQAAQVNQQENLQRLQIALDSRRAAEIRRIGFDFQNALAGDVEKVKAALAEADEGNLTDANLAKNARVAREFGLALREYLSHTEGMKEFILNTENDLKRMTPGGFNATESISQIEAGVEPYKELAALMRKSFEDFAGTDTTRWQSIADAMAVLKDV